MKKSFESNKVIFSVSCQGFTLIDYSLSMCPKKDTPILEMIDILRSKIGRKSILFSFYVSTEAPALKLAFISLVYQHLFLYVFISVYVYLCISLHLYICMSEYLIYCAYKEAPVLKLAFPWAVSILYRISFLQY